MNDLVKVLLAPPVAYCIDANYYKGTTIQHISKRREDNWLWKLPWRMKKI